MMGITIIKKPADILPVFLMEFYFIMKSLSQIIVDLLYKYVCIYAMDHSGFFQGFHLGRGAADAVHT